MASFIGSGNGYITHASAMPPKKSEQKMTRKSADPFGARLLPEQREEEAGGRGVEEHQHDVVAEEAHSFRPCAMSNASSTSSRFMRPAVMVNAVPCSKVIEVTSPCTPIARGDPVDDAGAERAEAASMRSTDRVRVTDRVEIAVDGHADREQQHDDEEKRDGARAAAEVEMAGAGYEIRQHAWP